MSFIRRVQRRMHPFKGVVPYSSYRSIKSANGFTPGTSNVHGYPVSYSDGDGFIHSVREVFTDEVYRFEAQSNTPHIIDAGANIGLSVIYFKQLYPESTIVAYEPDDAIFNLLEKNVKPFSGVDLRRAAAWTENGELTFYSEGSLAGSVSMDFLEKKNVQKVKSERLRDEIGKQHVDFLKIDIEGAENEVLFDIEDQLDNVDALFFEYHSVPDEQQRLGDMLNLVLSKGFRYYISGAHGARLPFVETVPHGFDLQLNVSCVRNR